MKSIVTDKFLEKPFPKLMKSKKTGTIILFEYSGKGTVVGNPIGSNAMGYVSTAWSMEKFIDFDGKILLEND